LLGEAAARPQGKSLSENGVFSRVGHTGERKAGSIGFSTIRGGGIVGEHTVMFIGENERLEITHRATDRRIYALGALRAAIWLANQPPGLYDMQDVLGLR
jgi:4-hydroxy-tetrahydrodipicolinate reductase